jgi:hypothetical protein
MGRRPGWRDRSGCSGQGNHHERHTGGDRVLGPGKPRSPGAIAATHPARPDSRPRSTRRSSSKMRPIPTAQKRTIGATRMTRSTLAHVGALVNVRRSQRKLSSIKATGLFPLSRQDRLVARYRRHRMRPRRTSKAEIARRAGTSSRHDVVIVRVGRRIRSLRDRGWSIHPSVRVSV